MPHHPVLHVANDHPPHDYLNLCTALDAVQVVVESPFKVDKPLFNVSFMTHRSTVANSPSGGVNLNLIAGSSQYPTTSEAAERVAQVTRETRSDDHGR